MTDTATGTQEPTPVLRPVGDAGAAFCDPDVGSACALPALTHENN